MAKTLVWILRGYNFIITTIAATKLTKTIDPIYLTYGTMNHLILLCYTYPGLLFMSSLYDSMDDVTVITIDGIVPLSLITDVS